MTISKSMRFRLSLGLGLAATLGSFAAQAAGGAPPLSFNPNSNGGFFAGVGELAAMAADPMLVNSSSSPAVITAITLSGANASEFSVSGGANAPCAVGTTIPRSGAAGNFCGLHFTFKPTSVGPFKQAMATVTFSNAPSASFFMEGTGAVAAPLLDLTSGINPSPAVALGATGQAFVAAYVSNRGAHTLTINGITISGANAADFAFTHVATKAPDCTVPGLVTWSPAPGVSCQIGIAFRPSAPGARSATLTLATDDPARPVVTIPLAGNGVVAPPPPPPAPVASTVYVTDLWWNPAEPAWSLNIVHHKQLVVGGPGSDAVIATWNTFDVNLAPTWVTLNSGTWTNGQTFTGVLHQTTGSYFANPYLPGQAADSVVGSATLTFSDANNGTLVYTLFGVTSSRAIVRKQF